MSAGAQAWIAEESSGSESTHRGELPVAARREDHQLALLGMLAGGVLNGDGVGDEDHITPDRRRPEDLMDLADTRGDLIARPWRADERPPGLDATEGEPCRIAAAAPRAGQYPRDGDFARAERLADLPCLLAARLGQVALGRAVLDPEAGGIPERADRARVAEHDDLTASAQERPQGLVVGDGGAGGRQDQHRTRGSLATASLGREHDLAELLALGQPRLRRRAVLERDHLVDGRLEPAREEQSHQVVELTPVGHRGPMMSTFQAELRLGRVLLLAPGTLHAGASQRAGAVGQVPRA